MKTFWKWITHLGSFPGVLLLIVPLLFLPSARDGTNFFSPERNDLLSFLTFLAISFVISLGAAVFTKYFFFKHRPEKMEYKGFWSKISAGSFPSMHTITVVVVASVVYMWEVIEQFPFRCVMIYSLIALAVGLSRIELKKHYPTDVLFGAIYAIIGTIISLYLSYGILSLF